MDAPELIKRVGLFAVIVILIAAAGVTFAGGKTTDTPTMTSLTVDTYSGNDTLASIPEESGKIELTADASGKVVMIDASHESSLNREQLVPLVETLTENGAEVRFLSTEGGARGGPSEESPFNKSLRQADAFIAIGAEQQYTQSQVNGLANFTDAGGRVLVVKEPPQIQPLIILRPSRPSQQSVPMPLTPLVSRFGISFGNGYLYNMHQYDTNYRNVYATPTEDGPLTDGVDRLVLHEATSVRGPDPVIQTVEQTELSETRQEGRYGVVVRSGNLVALSDSSVLGQGYYRRGDNEVFLGNLLDFLVSADKEPPNAPAPPEPPGEGNATQGPPRGFPQ